jgi:hypothetical protein
MSLLELLGLQEEGESADLSLSMVPHHHQNH